MYIDAEKFVDYFLQNDKETLKNLIEEEVSEELEYYLMYDKQICPNCFNNMKVLYENVLIQDNLYEEQSIGVECLSCGHKYYFN